MKISELEAWLDDQKALNGDVDVTCLTAFRGVIVGDVITVEELEMTVPGMLGLISSGLENDTKVVVAVLALGQGSDNPRVQAS
ncbi:hypothetical protein [Pseudomonas chlororaphis]